MKLKASRTLVVWLVFATNLPFGDWMQVLGDEPLTSDLLPSSAAIPPSA